MKIEIKKPKLNKKLFLTLFVWVTLFSIIQNPLLTPLNLIVETSQLTTQTNIPQGLTVQGSFIVNTNTKNVQATNSTSGQLVDAVQVNVTMINIMSILLLCFPFVVAATLHKQKNKVGAKKDAV